MTRHDELKKKAILETLGRCGPCYADTVHKNLPANYRNKLTTRETIAFLAIFSRQGLATSTLEERGHVYELVRE